MAVYTQLTREQLRSSLRPFRLGKLLKVRGVPAGTINTIYELRTTRGRFILRILEDRPLADARFEEALLFHLVTNSLPVPRMIAAGPHGSIISLSRRQHLSVFEYLPGREVAVFEVRPSHTEQIGVFLAGMHLAQRSLRRRRRGGYDPVGVMRIAGRCRRAVQKPSRGLRSDHLERIISRIERNPWPDSLPTGVIHGDLFIDNARFSRGRLCGVIDFEMACSGPLIYDIAVALCDWAFKHDKLEPGAAAALLRGYESMRPLSAAECRALYPLCLFAAARFALTRFHDFEVNTRPDAQRIYKDYRHFMDRLAALEKLGKRGFGKAVLAEAEG